MPKMLKIPINVEIKIAVAEAVIGMEENNYQWGQFFKKLNSLFVFDENRYQIYKIFR